MTRAVLDANVVASGVLRYEEVQSAPSAVLRAWYSASFTIIISAPLRAEIADTLLVKPYFVQRIPRAVAQRWLQRIDEHAESTVVTVAVTGVATHPEDDLILATAVSGNADYLVTGDKQLRAVGSFQGVTIVAPAEFLAVLDRDQEPR